MGEKGIEPASSGNKFQVFLRKFPGIPAAVIALLALLITGNRIANGVITFALMIAGFIAILAIGIVLSKKKKLTDDMLILLLFAAGFWIKLCYVLYTDINVRQCDVEVFKEGDYSDFHAGYILYLRDFMRLPDFDVALHGQFYHPPFHHFICALFLRLYELFLPSGTHNYECLQTLTLLWSFGTQYYMFKMIRLMGIRGKGLVNSALILSAFPMLTLFAGSVNNDILSLLLFFAAFCYGLEWYREGKFGSILISALCTGFGMMTKLSVGLIAFPMGFLFIVRFIKDIKAKKGLKSFGHLACFGVIAAPLGLWYSVRNLIRYNTPLGYVLRLDNKYMDISRYSLKDRLFGFYGFPVEDFYTNIGSDGEQDYNIFITQVKTMLFGYENCRDDMLMTLTGYFLLLISLILILTAFGGIIYVIVTMKKRGKTVEEMALVILFVTEIVSIVLFSLKYPHVCSQDFRYDFPALLTGVYGVAALTGSKRAEGLPGKGLKALCIAFFVMSVVYYAILWTYVKGEVLVVEPTW
ncbi:MAG: glycosyltransferase family 39 protein [Clostridiales bacterium]|nr:glycosyltransferase family 39 protein [Clostridiales bacterium]